MGAMEMEKEKGTEEGFRPEGGAWDAGADVNRRVLDRCRRCVLVWSFEDATCADLFGL